MNVLDLVKDNVRALKPYASARDDFKKRSKNYIYLDANENPFNNGVNRYPDPQQLDLKSMLSIQKEVSVAQILLGNGSDEVLDLIFRAFCNPNKDNVIILPPTYGMYEVLANINDVEVKKVNLLPGFDLDVDKILKAISACSKILFICSPNNPSGNNLNETAIENLLLKFNGIVVIDEAYIEFSQHKSWLNRLNDFPNLIITQTFSKAYAMAGLRLGTCYASREIITILNKIKPPYNINSLTQETVLKHLSKPSLVKQHVTKILSEKDRLLTMLNKVPFVKKLYPSDANFILVQVDDAQKRHQQLADKGIITRNRSCHYLCDNCLRITVGSPEDNNELIQTLNSIK